MDTYYSLLLMTADFHLLVFCPSCSPSPRGVPAQLVRAPALSGVLELVPILHVLAQSQDEQSLDHQIKGHAEPCKEVRTGARAMSPPLRAPLSTLEQCHHGSAAIGAQTMVSCF